MHLPVISNKFSGALYKELLPFAGSRNMIFAPSALHTTLSLALVGTEEPTRSEMLAGLQYDHDHNNQFIATNYGILLRTFVNGFEDESHFPVVTAKRIYRTHPKFNMDRYYKHLIPQFFCDMYRQQLEVNSTARCNASAKRVNYWVSKRSFRQIKEIITGHYLETLEVENPEKVKLILLNVAYCKAKWKFPFDPSATIPKEMFRVNSSRVVKVSMMQHFEFFPYAALPEVDADAVELPYECEGDALISLVIILPRSSDGLKNVQNQIPTILRGTDEVKALPLRFSRKAKIALSLPRFRIESALGNDLKSAMRALGMRTMFEDGRANFGKVSKVDARRNRPQTMFVSTVIQKVFLEVNEKGSCVTDDESDKKKDETPEELPAGGEDSVPEGERPKIIRFVANHPFYFHVVDKKHNLILLAGQCVDASMIQHEF